MSGTASYLKYLQGKKCYGLPLYEAGDSSLCEVNKVGVDESMKEFTNYSIHEFNVFVREANKVEDW